MWSELPKYYCIGFLFFLLLCAPPILAADTGYLSPSATGDDHTEWSNPANAFASDNQYAIETRNDQKQDWHGFGFSIPAGSTIDGITVSVEAQDNYCNAAEGGYVELSWDGGSNYTTTANRFIGVCGSDGTTYLGGASDTWSRTWAVDEFSAANFRVRLSKEGYDYDPAWVDHIQVRVHYTESGNTPPTITSNGGGETAAIIMAENLTAVTLVTATDPDPDPLTYALNGGEDDWLFLIDDTSGALTFDTPPDFEAPADLFIDNVYKVTVQVNDGQGGTDSQDIEVTIVDGEDTYPVSYGENNASEWITNVSYGGIDNTTNQENDGGRGYGDYTGLVADVEPGSTSDLSVTIHVDNQDYIMAWIDWNRDGDFADAGESYTVGTELSTDGPHVVSVTVPAAATLGTTLMRVSLQYLQTPDPDDILLYGEVEDYTVQVGFTAPGGTQTLYLDGVGDESDVPVAVLKTTVPTDTTLDNYDPNRDSFPGLYIAKGGSGVNESDPTKHQLWLDPAVAAEVDGSVILHIWTAVKDFDTVKAGSVTAFLVASNADGSVVTQLASDTISRADWDVGDTGTWIRDTLDFGTVSHQLGGAEQLGVKIIVEPTSGDHHWFAYDTTSYPSALVYALPGQTIAGTVFEDADFAGTAAGYDGGVGDIGLGDVDVELYDAGGTYIVSTVTSGDGSFSFAGLADGTYKVRVRSATIGDADTPPADGLHPTVPATWPYPLPELVWGHGAALTGGQDPSADDSTTGDNAGPGDAYVNVAVSGGDVTGVDFGVSYELIVNVDDDANPDNVRSKQGTLRQFIKNSNAIVGVNRSWFQIPGP